MPETMLNALVTMTQSLHDELKKRPDGPARMSVLVESENGWDHFHEEFIPVILRNAGWTLEGEHILAEELDGFCPEDYGIADWPTGLKLIVLEAARDNWNPPGPEECSEWTGGSKPALELFQAAPELLDVFTKPPAEVAQAWTMRTSVIHENYEPA